MQCNFKLIGEDLCCRICGARVSIQIEGGWILTSESEGDEEKGICHTCLVEHCCSTNCLGCDLYGYPDCPHIELKKLYMEED